MNFLVREYQPSFALAPFVDCYWNGNFNINAAPDAAFNMIPNACLELIIHLDNQKCRLPGRDGWSASPDYMLIGLITKVHQVRFKTEVPVFTIRFKPEALYELFGVSSAEMLNTYEDIDVVLDREFRDICYRVKEVQEIHQIIPIVEKHLLGLQEQRRTERSFVGHAAELMRNTDVANIEQISGMVSISPRQLGRKFREVIGVRPKEYLRLVRFNKVMRMLNHQQSLDLTSVAYHCGYFDQAHFIKDFRRVTGINPRLYFRERQHYIALPAQRE